MQENLLDSIDGFGPIFHGYANKPEKAIGKLLTEKSGEVPDAYRHPELGEIGFVYGLHCRQSQGARREYHLSSA